MYRNQTRLENPPIRSFGGHSSNSIVNPVDWEASKTLLLTASTSEKSLKFLCGEMLVALRCGLHLFTV